MQGSPLEVNLIESRLVAQFLVVGAQAGGLNIPWLRDGISEILGICPQYLVGKDFTGQAAGF
jgi:hypothetical protein